MSLKVLLLSDSNSEHTEKWAMGLAAENIEVGLFSFNKSTYKWYENVKNITVLYEPESGINANTKFTKLNYFSNVADLKKAIAVFKPDILHAHYATSYGLIGALADFHPYIISSWGTDVMKFPQKNFLNRSILRYNLKKADVLCATSFTIKDYINQVISKDVKVIPFGVDTDVFKPRTVKNIFGAGDFVVGSIKPLEKLYNIDVIIEA
ncbi:MAG: glycosyltransferase, partial [Bacteroidia bacterium]